MDQIPPYQLWLGHDGDGRESRALNATGIQAVVQLAMEELPLQPPRELIYLRFPLIDGSGNATQLLALAIRSVAKLIATQVPTLVCSERA